MRRLASAFLLLALATLPTTAADSRVLEGSYQWSNGDDGPLEATFVATGPETYEVVFRFRFQGKKNTWKGTATGSLEDGAIKGRVKAGRMKRYWVFECAFDGSSCQGNHAEDKNGELVPSGTLSLGS